MRAFKTSSKASGAVEVVSSNDFLTSLVLLLNIGSFNLGGSRLSIPEFMKIDK